MIHHGCKIQNQEERQQFFDWLENMEYKICSIPRPDAIIFLSLSFENNLELIEKRAQEKGISVLDLHERNTDYMKKAWETAHQIAKQYDWEIVECETEGKLLERSVITEKILQKIF